MGNVKTLGSIKETISKVGLEGKSLLSINDISNDQIYALFDLAKLLEPWNYSKINLIPEKVMSTLFFQPSTRTRMSFETAMQRVGGSVISEANPMVTSSAAKEESLSDMLKVVSRYANIIVIRHPNDVEARNAIPYSDAPVINGGLGHWEHPTQALLDLYTLWSVKGRIEGANVCVASPDLIGARTGHSMALGLARLGANVTLACDEVNRIPVEVRNKFEEMGVDVAESFDHTQDSFNQLIKGMDLVYLPGCSAPKGAASDKFKELMSRYFVRYETLEEVRKAEGRNIYVTHTLPRREGEMDLRIDDSPYQLHFNAISYSVSIRMALIVAILGFKG